ncbi:hypothetical protein [Maridesulfovibrio sp.]|uniref:hypothetical protein n=1 Tax=Maridesulfovibrio sp. TaxID=2795000 RepID=UPI0037493413
MRLVSEFYRIFIRPIDPGLFMTKYAAKSICACLVALLLAYLVGMSTKFLQWSAYGSMVVVVFRAGSTLAKRKAVTRWLTLVVMVLVPFSTVIGNYSVGLEIYLFLLAFAVFFCSGAWGVVCHCRHRDADHKFTGLNLAGYAYSWTGAFRGGSFRGDGFISFHFLSLAHEAGKSP